MFIEISSLAGYALIAVGEKKAPFAAFRYLIIGTIGASFYLLGIGYLFYERHT
jgi:multicomponent Na+:H+ antiporter subunit D